MLWCKTCDIWHHRQCKRVQTPKIQPRRVLCYVQTNKKVSLKWCSLDELIKLQTTWLWDRSRHVILCEARNCRSSQQQVSALLCVNVGLNLTLPKPAKYEKCVCAWIRVLWPTFYLWGSPGKCFAHLPYPDQDVSRQACILKPSLHCHCCSSAAQILCCPLVVRCNLCTIINHTVWGKRLDFLCVIFFLIKWAHA